MKPLTPLSESEHEIMQYIWENDVPVTTSVLVSIFSATRGWKIQTISTFLTRLVEKGMLECYKEGAQNRYIPLISEQVYRTRTARRFLEQEHGGSIKNFLTALYDVNGISTDEIEELKSWLDEEARK